MQYDLIVIDCVKCGERYGRAWQQRHIFPRTTSPWCGKCGGPLYWRTFRMRGYNPRDEDEIARWRYVSIPCQALVGAGFGLVLVALAALLAGAL